MHFNTHTLSAFPAEIWLIVARILNNDDDLQSLSRMTQCSKALRKAALKPLYHKFSTGDAKADGRRRPLTAFFRAVSQSQKLASLLCNLQITLVTDMDNTDTDEGVEENSLLIQRMANRLGVSRPDPVDLARDRQPYTMLEMLLSLPNISKLHLGESIGIKAQNFKRHLESWGALSPNNRLTSLTELGVDYVNVEAAVQLTGVSGLVTGIAPNLQKLRVHIRRHEWFKDLKATRKQLRSPVHLETTKRMFSQLRTLCIYHEWLDETKKWYQMVRYCEKLEALDINTCGCRRITNRDHRQDELDEFEEALRHAKDMGLEQHIAEKMPRNIYTLKHLHSLRSLDADQFTIETAASARKETRGDFLVNFLPSSIEHMHLWLVGGTLVPDLKVLARYIADGKYPHLRNLDLSFLQWSGDPLTEADGLELDKLFAEIDLESMGGSYERTLSFEQGST